MSRIATVAALVAAHPTYFAAPRFTKPTLGGSVFPSPEGPVFFVTGDKLSHQRHVAYTVRRADGAEIKVVGGLATWKSRATAEKQASALAKGFPGLHSVPAGK